MVNVMGPKQSTNAKLKDDFKTCNNKLYTFWQIFLNGAIILSINLKKKMQK